MACKHPSILSTLDRTERRNHNFTKTVLRLAPGCYLRRSTPRHPKSLLPHSMGCPAARQQQNRCVSEQRQHCLQEGTTAGEEHSTAQHACTAAAIMLPPRQPHPVESSCDPADSKQTPVTQRYVTLLQMPSPIPKYNVEQHHTSSLTHPTRINTCCYSP